jgi:hypothetical protein
MFVATAVAITCAVVIGGTLPLVVAADRPPGNSGCFAAFFLNGKWT